MQLDDKKISYSGSDTPLAALGEYGEEDHFRDVRDDAARIKAWQDTIGSVLRGGYLEPSPRHRIATEWLKCRFQLGRFISIPTRLCRFVNSGNVHHAAYGVCSVRNPVPFKNCFFTA